MVSTHGHPCRSVRRTKSKVRMKRTKRKIARRIGTTTLSDSKSSLDNLENLPPPPDRIITEDLQAEPTIKKRSLSEERPSSRIQMGQRSASVQLENAQSHQSKLLTSVASKILPKQQQKDVANSLPLKKAWFFSWPVRLVVPKRIHIEDEGFDSFHGNNSSSSDFENDDKIEIATSSGGQLDDPRSADVVEVSRIARSADCQNYSSKLETCDLDLLQNGHQQDTTAGSAVGEVNQPLLRRRRNVPSIAIKLIPPDTNQSYTIQSESESEIPRRNPKSVTILSSQRYINRIFLCRVIAHFIISFKNQSIHFLKEEKKTQY